VSGEDDEYPFCSGPPECVHCTPVGLLCDHNGLMPAEDEAHERGVDVAEVIAAREEATTP
jgi:hypothetical protein